MLPMSAVPISGALGALVWRRLKCYIIHFYCFTFYILHEVWLSIWNSGSIISSCLGQNFNFFNSSNCCLFLCRWCCCCLGAFWEGIQLQIYIGYKSGNSLMIQHDRKFPNRCFPESYHLVL